jgi:uncharacterized membrane protein YcaP (DUF421 family)
MLNIFCRTLIIYLVVIIAMRMMGKRQIGEFEPSEFVIAIMISEVATVPLENISIPIFHGIVPVITLIIAEIMLSFFCLKNSRFRNMVIGRPTVIIQNGVLIEKELKRLRFNLEDIIEELRNNGYPNISEIECAVLETNGHLSVLLKPEYNPVTRKDLQIQTDPSSICHVLVKDGIVLFSELERINRDLKWLNSQIKKQNIKKLDDVFFACIDPAGKVYIQKKEEKTK